MSVKWWDRLCKARTRNCSSRVTISVRWCGLLKTGTGKALSGIDQRACEGWRVRISGDGGSGLGARAGSILRSSVVWYKT
jgi:hypothetical protein